MMGRQPKSLNGTAIALCVVIVLVSMYGGCLRYQECRTQFSAFYCLTSQ